MVSSTDTDRRAPRLMVRLEELRAVRTRGSFRATWRVRNDGAATATIARAWHPHGRFRSRRHALAIRVAPGRSATFHIAARSDVAPAEVVENVFLILQVTTARRRWRVFARFQISGRAGGPPLVRVEAVDAHPAEG